MVTGSNSPNFSEEVCYCTHRCCFTKDSVRLDVPDFEIWDCYECRCHWHSLDVFEGDIKYQRFKDEYWGD